MIRVGNCVISWLSSTVVKCHRRILLECCGSSGLAPGFDILSDKVINVLYYILILSSLGGWYQHVYIYIQMCTDWCHSLGEHTTQKRMFSVKDFFSKCDQIRSFQRICSHVLKKSLMENFNFCAVRWGRHVM